MKKYVFFLLVLGTGNYLYAQQTERPFFMDFMNKRNEFSTRPTQKIIVNPERKISNRKYHGQGVTTSPVAQLSHSLPNGNKVYILPQDNMPCVVPDIRFYKMPVGSSGLGLDKGINGAPPQSLIPSTGK
jgi:hypothetical protein